MPDPDNLQEIATFLLSAPVDKPDPDWEHESFKVNGVSIENLMATRHTANPGNIESLIEAVVRLLASDAALSRNTVAAWGWVAVVAQGARPCAGPGQSTGKRACRDSAADSAPRRIRIRRAAARHTATIRW